MKKPKIAQIDKVPKGWFTRAQLEKKWNLSQAHVNHILCVGVKDKTLSIKRFRIMRPTGVPYPTPHYREK
jgi:hypothetical protein